MNSCMNDERIHIITSCKDISINHTLKTLQQGIPQLFFVMTERYMFNGLENAYLTTADKKKISSLQKVSDQNNCTISHAIINYIYTHLLGGGPEDLLHCLGKYKKPYISNEFNMQYNISHTSGGVLLGLCIGEIGVDIEYCEENFNFTDLALGLFSPIENQYINADRRNFYKLWVAKEAYLKYKGTGLLCDLNNIIFVEEKDNRMILLDKESMTEHVIFLKDHLNYVIGFCYS